MFTRTLLIAALLAAPSALGAVVAKRDHQITFVNNCPQTVTPMLHAVDGSFNALQALGQGQSTSTSVPEGWHAGRTFGQTGQCSQPDGTGCTLLECDFSNPGFRQCNLSRVSGFNIPMAFQFNGGGCGGNRCGDANCDGGAAFSTQDNGGASLRQCNDANVPMTVTFC